MVVRKVLLVVLSIGTAIGSGLLTAQERGDKPTADPKGIQRLIDRLGSGQFATRDQAAKQLLDLGEAALPALQKALQSLDPEVRRRAEQIMAEIKTKAEERVVEKLLAEANQAGLDKLIARMVNEKGFATEERWKVMETLAQAIAARAAEVGGKRVRTPAMDVSKLPTAREPKEDQFTKVRVLTPGTKELLSIEGCVFLSSGPIQFVTNLQDSIVVVDGDIDCTTIQNCIILCRGNVKGATSIEGSVVLATGKMNRAGDIEDSLIQVSGVGQCNGSQRSIYVNLAKSPANLSQDDRCVQTKEGPLQLFRFSAGDSPRK